MFIAGMLDRMFWFFGPIASATGLPRKENNLSFKYIDIVKKEDLNYILGLGFTTQKIPGIIYKCKVYMGAKTKEEYLEILKNVNVMRLTALFLIY